MTLGDYMAKTRRFSHRWILGISLGSVILAVLLELFSQYLSRKHLVSDATSHLMTLCAILLCVGLPVYIVLRLTHVRTIRICIVTGIFLFCFSEIIRIAEHAFPVAIGGLEPAIYFLWKASIPLGFAFCMLSVCFAFIRMLDSQITFEEEQQRLMQEITERQEVENALRESEEKYRVLTENIKDVVWTLDTQTMRFLYVSPSVERLRGYTSEEVLAAPLEAALMPEAVESLKLRIRQGVENYLSGRERPDRFYTDEIEQPCKDGSTIWTETITNCSLNEKTGHVELHGVARNITSRKYIEQVLQESEARLLQAQAVAHVGNWELDLTTKRVWGSAEAFRIYGLERTSHYLSLVKVRASFVGEEKARLMAILRALKQSKGPYDEEFRIVRASDGASRVIHIVGNLVCDANGIPIKIVGVVQDITERKQAEEALRENEAKQRVMIANISDVIAVVDQDGINRYKSPNIERWFGWRPEDLVGKVTWENIHPDDLAREQKNMAKIMARPNATGTGQCRYRCKDGTYKWIESTSINLLHDPHLRGVLLNYHDISDRKRAEEDRSRLETRLRQAQKMEAIGTLAGGIAHDFNNILQSLLGFAHLAYNEALEGSMTKSCIQEVLIAGERARGLIEQILAFSRKREQDRKPVKLQSIAEEALRLLRGSLPSTIEIQYEADASCGPVFCDPAQMHQILMNLCTNAFHAMRSSGGILHVYLREIRIDKSMLIHHPDLHEGNFAVLKVSDTGHGMDDAIMKRIFEPYFTTRAVGEGTGLGLSVVHGIVKELGGVILVESHVGIGTTFAVYLPTCLPSEQLEQTADQQDEALLQGTERILLVDDEIQIVRMTGLSLRQYGYEVETCTDSQEARERVQASPNQYDVVVTDQTMPHLTGIQLTAELLQIRPDLPIILCTGYSDLVDEEKAKVVGVREFLKKPFMPDTLAQVVRRVLDNTTS